MFTSSAYTFWLVDLFLFVVFALVLLGRKKRFSSTTFSWLLSFLLLPGFGQLMYLVVGYRSLRRKQKLKRLLAKSHAQNKPPLNHSESSSDILLIPEQYRQLFILAKSISHFDVAGGNSLQLFDQPNTSYATLANAINEAKSSIHLEYYIFRPDNTGEFFAELLCKKAQAGVHCRLLLDYIGSFFIPNAFLQKLKTAGVKVAFFLPFHFREPWALQLRNHRKLAVIDGTQAFIGSQNITDDHVKRPFRACSWRDTVVHIAGPAARQLQVIFAEDWQFSTKETLHYQECFPEPPPTGQAFAQIIPTGPNEHDYSFEVLITALIHSARNTITITTPYFIPTPSLLVALEAAHRKGVTINVLLPASTDHWLVDRIAKGWYSDIIRAGAKLHLYDEAFIHSKMITIDNEISLIGSANMDERSFRLNFECSSLVYDQVFTQNCNQIFQSLITKSKTLTPQTLKSSHLTDIRDGFFRLFSPLA